jgi:hypothetical protein
LELNPLERLSSQWLDARSTVALDQFHDDGQDAQDSRKNQYAYGVVTSRHIPDLGDF